MEEELSFKRGDTQPFNFSITNADNTVIPLEEIETLILTCRKYCKIDSPVLFQKSKSDFTCGEDGLYHCRFNPVDTEELKYGIYNFDIEVTLTNGYRKTLKSQFEITEEVTIHEEVTQ